MQDQQPALQGHTRPANSAAGPRSTCTQCRGPCRTCRQRCRAVQDPQLVLQSRAGPASGAAGPSMQDSHVLLRGRAGPAPSAAGPRSTCTRCCGPRRTCRQRCRAMRGSHPALPQQAGLAHGAAVLCQTRPGAAGQRGIQPRDQAGAHSHGSAPGPGGRVPPRLLYHLAKLGPAVPPTVAALRPLSSLRCPHRQEGPPKPR